MCLNECAPLRLEAQQKDSRCHGGDMCFSNLGRLYRWKFVHSLSPAPMLECLAFHPRRSPRHLEEQNLRIGGYEQTSPNQGGLGEDRALTGCLQRLRRRFMQGNPSVEKAARCSAYVPGVHIGAESGMLWAIFSPFEMLPGWPCNRISLPTSTMIGKHRQRFLQAASCQRPALAPAWIPAN